MILFKAKKFDGTKTVIETEFFRLCEIYPFSIKRCTGVQDDGDHLIYEGDELEAYDKNGDVLYSGTVIYSTIKGAFILAGKDGKNVSDLPIGELIKDRICHVVVNG